MKTRPPILCSLCVSLAIVVGTAAAQQFDVASIKPNNSGANTLSVRIAPGGRLTAMNASLRSLVTAAYQIRFFQLAGGPSWMDSARYDIQAKGPLKPGIKPADQISQMLQALLADRFQLKVHKETRDMPVFALTVAKNGPKLESAKDTPCFDPTAGLPPPIDDLAAGRIRPCGGFNRAPGQMSGARVTMKDFTSTLGTVLNRTVIDKTGLNGTYDIALKWTPDEPPASLPPDAPATPQAGEPGPSIFTAISEQLGLRLESQKGPVEVIVIDSAEKPSPN